MDLTTVQFVDVATENKKLIKDFVLCTNKKGGQTTSFFSTCRQYVRHYQNQRYFHRRKDNNPIRKSGKFQRLTHL